MPSNNHRNIAAADPESNKAEIIAERFKTRLCKSYRKSGECPYFHRCMFAHGKDDIRTTEQNVAAGLVTENAVKAWGAPAPTSDVRRVPQRRVVAVAAGGSRAARPDGPAHRAPPQDRDAAGRCAGAHDSDAVSVRRRQCR